MRAARDRLLLVVLWTICAFATIVAAPRLALASGLTWALEAEATPRQMFLGLETGVELTVRNTGARTWSPREGDRISYHWLDADGELLVRDGVRTQLPGEVVPGEAMTVSARVRPPQEPGRYSLEWAMVREGVMWFPAPSEPRQLHEIEVVRGEIAWALEAVSLPEAMTPGAEVTAKVRLSNRGDVPWEAGSGDTVAYHWWTEEGVLAEREGLRTSLPQRVAPGESVELEVKVAPVRHAGPGARRFCLEVAPLRERVRWWGPANNRGVAPWPCALVDPDPQAWGVLDEDAARVAPLDGGAMSVRATLINLGGDAWPQDARVGTQWLTREGALVDEGPRVELPSQVLPGELVEVELALDPPEDAGDYRLRLGIVREGVRWYGPPVLGQAELPIEVTPRSLAWELNEAESISGIWVNRSREVTIKITNRGDVTWSEDSGDHLSYHWVGRTGQPTIFDGRRTSLPGPVEPGETVEIRATVLGPEGPGFNRLEWEMVREHVRWYGPPTRAPKGETWVRARWLSVVITGLLGLFGVLGVLALRLAPPRGRVRVALVEYAPVVWVLLAYGALSGSFFDFSAIDPWDGSRLITASVACMLALPVAALRGRARAWAAFVVVFGLALLTLGDLIYMHYFGGIIPVVALTASHHLGEVSDSAFAELERVWVWLSVLPLVSLLGAVMWPASIAPKEPARPPEQDELARGARIWAAARPRLPVVVVLLSLCAPACVRLGGALNSELGHRVYSERHNVARLGLVAAHLFDLGRTLRERGRRGIATPEQRERLVAAHAARAQEAAARTEGSPEIRSEGAKNLLLIQVEAAQTWVVGLDVGGQPIMPFTRELIDSRARWYPNVVDQTHQGKTSDAEYSVLGSQHPLSEGTVCFLRAENHFWTLAHVLSERGYATLSAHPYHRGFWNRATLHPRYGFERSLFRRELGDGPITGWGLADGPFFERIVPELRELPQPWFAFLVTLSLHHPYDSFPAELSALELGELDGTRVGNYLQALNYFDRSLERLLEELEAAGLLDHTIVAFYGDHDARFELDHYPEVVELAGAPRWAPGLFHRLERVPLLILDPDDSEPETIETVGGHVDVAPTLLDRLGIERPQAFFGQPLVADAPGDPEGGFAAYPDGSAFSSDRMFVAQGRGIPREGGCFDLPSGRSRPRVDCDAIAERAARELSISRAVVDLDLHRELAGRE